MIKRDYFRELQELRNDVINDIKYLLRNNSNEMKKMRKLKILLNFMMIQILTSKKATYTIILLLK